MFRTVVALWIYVSSLAAVALSAEVLHYALRAFPKQQLLSYGPRVAAFSQGYSNSASFQPIVLWVVALASIASVGYFWWSARSADVRNFAIATIAAINLAASTFSVMNFFIAFFLLPKLANGGL